MKALNSDCTWTSPNFCSGHTMTMDPSTPINAYLTGGRYLMGTFLLSHWTVLPWNTQYMLRSSKGAKDDSTLVAFITAGPGVRLMSHDYLA